MQPIVTNTARNPGRTQLPGGVGPGPARAGLEAELAEASRLAALGVLLPGAAHRLRNPLAAALADVGLATEVVREVRDGLRAGPLGPDEAARRLDAALESLAEAGEAARRIERIACELAAHGRADAPRGPVRLGDALRKALHWLPSSVGRVATIQVEDAGAPDVVAPQGHVEQVVLHLVTHATRAIREGRRAALVLWTGEGEPGMARLEVVDRSGDLDLALLESLLDPRADPPRDGVSLGLAAIRRIVHAIGGRLSCAGDGGTRSAFRIDLPAAGRGS